MAIRLGLIGAGRWGRNLIRTISGMEDATLARVASRNPETSALVGPCTEVVADWTILACADDLDGVIIASPPGLHLAMARRAIESGIPLLIEKPLCLDPAEADAFRAFVETSHAFAMVEHTHLNSGAFEALLDRASTLGPPVQVMTQAGNWGPFRKDAPVLFDWGSHDIPMLLALFGGLPTHVNGRCTDRQVMDGGGEGASWTLNLHFSAGEAEVSISNLLGRKRRLFRADFADAVLVYDDLDEDKLKMHRPPPTPGALLDEGVPLPVPGDPPLARSVARFVKAIQRGAGDGSLALGQQAIEILEDCRMSSEC